MNPVLQTILIALLVGVLMSAVTFAWARLGRSRDRKSDRVLNAEVVAIEEVKNRDRRIEELERSVAQLEARSAEQRKAAIPIEAAMQAMLIAKLTNAHTPEADALLKKQTDGTLTSEDAAELARAMLERTTDMGERVSEAQRIAAGILAGVTRLKELEESSDHGSVKTVMVTVPETETVAALDGGTQESEKV